MAPPTFIRISRKQAHCNYYYDLAEGFFWTVCAEIEKNYRILCIILAMLVLTFVIPEIARKYHFSKKMREMQKILNMISKEVDRAEVACLTAADKVYELHRNVRDNSTETVSDVRDFAICTSKILPTTHSEPVQVEKKIGFLRKIFFPHRNVSNKEIALMSYIYTNSFHVKDSFSNTTIRN